MAAEEKGPGAPGEGTPPTQGAKGGEDGQALAPRTAAPVRAPGGGLAGLELGLMRQMMEDLDRALGNVGGRRASPHAGEAGGSSVRGGPFAEALWTPQVEVFERDGNLVVRAELPGLKENELRVEVQKGALLIAGEQRVQHHVQVGPVSRSASASRSFRRTIPLPDGADRGSASAHFANGVLEVTLKLPQQQARRVEVKGE